MSAINICS